MARDGKPEAKPYPRDTEDAESESAASDAESVETTVPPQSTLQRERREKFNRRESWYDLDLDEKQQDMIDKLEDVANEKELIQWMRQDSTIAFDIVNFLRVFYQKHKEGVKELAHDIQASGREAMEAGQEVEELKKSKAHLQQIVREQAGDIQRLQEQMIASPAPSSTNSATTKKLPDISIWTGGTSQAFKSWLSDLRMKLQVNADHFPTDTHKVAYLFNRLREGAREYMQSFLNDDESQESYDYYIQQLKRRFMDPQRAATARNNYSTLKQMNKDLATFLGEFYRLAAAAKVSEDW